MSYTIDELTVDTLPFSLLLFLLLNEYVIS